MLRGERVRWCLVSLVKRFKAMEKRFSQLQERIGQGVVLVVALVATVRNFG